MYTSILIVAWLWYPLRRKVKSLPIWAFLLLILPMGLEGATHLISDFWDMVLGFRDSNAWLALVTINVFPSILRWGCLGII